MKRGEKYQREMALRCAQEDLGKDADFREIIQRARKYRDFFAPYSGDQYWSQPFDPLNSARLDLGLTKDGLDADLETVIERAQQYMEFMLENPDATVAEVYKFPHIVPNDGLDQGGVS